jgi:hypothetical protein
LLPALAGVSLLWAVGCEGAAEREEARAREAEKQAEKPAEVKKALIGPNVFLEVQGKRRRVLVSASVCLREGALELLMCRKNTKEHEAILTADVNALDVHKALIAAGAAEGAPARFRPKYRPATGTAIKVSLTYDDKGKSVTVPAQSWVKNMKDGKTLDTDWVFAGSQLVDNPLDPKGGKLYLANDGDLVCVANFETALLDIPVESSKDDADRVFVAFTDRIPPLETKVVVVLEPVPAPKKDK